MTEPVHPRACGEQISACPPAALTHGSSPRLRGTAKTGKTYTALYRFIPAPAGNRLSAATTTARCSVHPRACGEQSWSVTPGNLHSGSSPRLRGTGQQGFPRRGFRRFIPAPAGNRSSPWLGVTGIAVHPRACGEQNVQGSFFTVFAGSSPRLRGTDLIEGELRCLHRFIPAPAGNS